MVNEKSERISFIIGAGASLDICPELSTKNITDFLLGKKKDDDDVDLLSPEYIELLNDIYNELKANKDANFENIFQYLSDIQINYSSDVNHILKFNLPSIKKLSGVDEKYIVSAKEYILHTIFNYVCNRRLLMYGENSWKNTIFSAVQMQNYFLDIFILNYDDYLDYVVDDYNDGFVKSGEERSIGPYWVFDEEYSHRYENTNLLNHLHGSIHFSRCYPASETKIVPMYKYACTTKSPYIEYATQDKRKASYYPIVTGLDKLNSLMHPPYRCYHTNFERSLMLNKRLIIIGYGFGDYYINSTIDSFIQKFDSKMLIISPSKPSKICVIPDSEKNSIVSDVKNRIFWFNGIFKDASNSDRLVDFIKNEFVK